MSQNIRNSEIQRATACPPFDRGGCTPVLPKVCHSVTARGNRLTYIRAHSVDRIHVIEYPNCLLGLLLHRAGTTDYDSVDREIGTTGGRILLPIPIHRYLAKSTEYRYRTHDFC